MIVIKELQKSFGRIEVLRSINMQFKAGECIALIGPNGCGKTTLFKSILNMVIPDKGEIVINNINIKNSYDYRKIIGFMPQIGRYPENMTIGQVIKMIQSLRVNDTNLDLDLFEKFKMKGLLHQKMGTLSGGTRQKVSAVIAFLFKPDILILDEPTAGLDPLSSEILREKIVAEKRKGKLIVISSHLLSELDDLVTEIVYIQDGTIGFHKKSDLLKEETNQTTIAKAITEYIKLKTVC